MIPVLSASLGLVLLAACAEFLRHALLSVGLFGRVFVFGGLADNG